MKVVFYPIHYKKGHIVYRLNEFPISPYFINRNITTDVYTAMFSLYTDIFEEPPTLYQRISLRLCKLFGLISKYDLS